MTPPPACRLQAGPKIGKIKEQFKERQTTGVCLRQTRQVVG